MYAIGDKILYPMHGAGVIEGIEEKEEFEYLQGLGVDLYQGYYLARPA